MTDLFIQLLVRKMHQTLADTVQVSANLKTLGELLLQSKREGVVSQIPERIIQLSATIHTEMELINELLHEEVMKIKESQQ